jgi:hypothetical protein
MLLHVRQRLSQTTSASAPAAPPMRIAPRRTRSALTFAKTSSMLALRRGGSEVPTLIDSLAAVTHPLASDRAMCSGPVGHQVKPRRDTLCSVIVRLDNRQSGSAETMLTGPGRSARQPYAGDPADEAFALIQRGGDG